MKDIKYYILRSLTLVILELLPQTVDSFRVLCHILSIIFPNFLSHFHGDLEKFWWYHLLEHDLFYTCTKFHSNLPKNIEILEGAQCAPPPPPPPRAPLGLVDIKIAWALYAVKAQRSLAPLSRFRGSHTTTHAHQCCIFQSYAKPVPSRMKLTMKLMMHEPTFMGSITTDTWSWFVTSDFNSV